jgi:hypothetical protein
VIYFFHDIDTPVFLLMVYAKARREDLSPDEKRIARALVTELKQMRREARRSRP